MPIFQKRLITFAFDHLLANGVTKLIVNTHHLPDEFGEAFPDSRYGKRPLQLVHEPVLLDTGGGIKNIANLLGREPFITYSGDILTDFDLQPLIEEHFRHANDVTLALRDTGIARAVALRGDRVVDIANRYGHAGNYDFANVAVWNSAILDRIPAGKKISFIPVLAEWIGAGGKIGGVVVSDGKWFNIGSRTQYIEVHRLIANRSWQPRYSPDACWRAAIAGSATIDDTAQMRGCSAVAENCRVEAGAILDDTIVWAGAQIASRAVLKNCIVRRQRAVEGKHCDADL